MTTTWHNLLIHGDNLKALQMLLADSLPTGSDFTRKINCIYIDPPFATNNDFFHKNGDKSYSDKMLAKTFLDFLEKRLLLMKQLLADDGAIFIHLDHHISHYVKILLDEIFGEKNFRNEIIWNYVSGGISDRFFARKHDTIFFYTKSDNYIFHPQKERRKQYNAKSIQKDEKGEFVWYIRPGTNPKVPRGVKTYLDKYVQDVWDIPIVNPMAKERVGYPTQKPEELLERIIRATTNPGDLVADFFAGSGTTGIVAEKLNRRWIMCDSGENALQTIKQRLETIADSYSLESKPAAYKKPAQPYSVITLR